jgi:hypothetical protein
MKPRLKSRAVLFKIRTIITSGKKDGSGGIELLLIIIPPPNSANQLRALSLEMYPKREALLCLTAPAILNIAAEAQPCAKERSLTLRNKSPLCLIAPMARKVICVTLL